MARAFIGYQDEYIGWTSDTYFEGCTWDYCEDVPIVNGSSYSGMDGVATTILGIHEQHIGDTIKVYCGYYWDYGSQYLDSLGIIVEELN